MAGAEARRARGLLIGSARRRSAGWSAFGPDSEESAENTSGSRETLPAALMTQLHLDLIQFLHERDCRHLCREPTPNPASARLAGRPCTGRGGADRRSNPRRGQRARAQGRQGERRCLRVASADLVSTGCRYCRACACSARAGPAQPSWDRGYRRPACAPLEGRGRTRPLRRCRLLRPDFRALSPA